MDEVVCGGQDAVLQIDGVADIDDAANGILAPAVEGDDDLLGIRLLRDAGEVGDSACDGIPVDERALVAGVEVDDTYDVEGSNRTAPYITEEPLCDGAGADHKRSENARLGRPMMKEGLAEVAEAESCSAEQGDGEDGVEGKDRARQGSDVEREAGNSRGGCSKERGPDKRLEVGEGGKLPPAGVLSQRDKDGEFHDDEDRQRKEPDTQERGVEFTVEAEPETARESRYEGNRMKENDRSSSQGNSAGNHRKHHRERLLCRPDGFIVAVGCRGDKARARDRMARTGRANAPDLRA